MAQQPPPGQYPPPGQPTPPPPPSGFPPPAPQQGPGFGAKAGAAAKAAGMSIVMRLVIGVIIVGVLLVGGYIFKLATGDPETAKTGDCVTDAPSADDMKIVECTDATAAYKVIERVDNPADKGTSDDTAQAACEAAGEKGATTMLWQEDAKTGDIDYVLCLGPTS